MSSHHLTIMSVSFSMLASSVGRTVNAKAKSARWHTCGSPSCQPKCFRQARIPHFFPKQDSSLHIHASPSLSSLHCFSAPVKFQLLSENALFPWQVLLWFIPRMLAQTKNILIHPYSLFSFLPSLPLASASSRSMLQNMRQWLFTYVLMFFLLRRFPTVADYVWTFCTNKHTNNASLRCSVQLAFEETL